MAAPRYADDEGMDVDYSDEEDPNVKRRGRGFNIRGQHAAAGEANEDDDVAMQVDGVRSRNFDRLDDRNGDEDEQGGSTTTERSTKAAKSIEGWVIIVTNVHEEASEDDVMDKFLDFGDVKTCHLNLDRRTGYVKGYALLEFAAFKEAQAAIEACKHKEVSIMEQDVAADFAFVKPPSSSHPSQQNRSGGRGRRRRGPQGGARDDDGADDDDGDRRPAASSGVDLRARSPGRR